MAHQVTTEFKSLKHSLQCAMDQRVVSTYIWPVELVDVTCLLVWLILIPPFDCDGHNWVLFYSNYPIVVAISSTIVVSLTSTLIRRDRLIGIELKIVRRVLKIAMARRLTVDLALQLGQVLLFLGHVCWLVDRRFFRDQRHLIKLLLSCHGSLSL